MTQTFLQMGKCVYEDKSDQDALVYTSPLLPYSQHTHTGGTKKEKKKLYLDLAWGKGEKQE